MKEYDEAPTCNFCCRKMPYSIETDSRNISVCLNPECTAFGQLQIGAEIIAEFLKNKEKKK